MNEYEMEHPTATPGPLTNFRENVHIPTDPRGNHAPSNFMMVTSIDNGQVLNAGDNTLSPPPFGNC